MDFQDENREEIGDFCCFYAVDSFSSALGYYDICCDILFPKNKGIICIKFFSFCSFFFVWNIRPLSV